MPNESFVIGCIDVKAETRSARRILHAFSLSNLCLKSIKISRNDIGAVYGDD